MRAEIEYALAKAATDRSGLIVPVVFVDPEEALEALAGFSRRTQTQLRAVGWMSFGDGDFRPLPPGW